MFTSRLPVSTVRRPTNPSNDGSTSFGGSIKRQTNIPVTIRKANLFTPQTVKQRPLSFGPSTAGKSLFNTDKKYQRPSKQLPDRDQQTKMLDNLIEFMKNNAPHLPPPDARRFFSSVSTTESTRIFQCLIEKLIPEFRVNRLEVDVPEALTLLGYPYTRSVTKSSLISVTTRQAAVGLLFIFQWLMNEIEDQTSCEDVLADPVSVIDHAYNLVVSQPEDIELARQEMLDKIWPSKDTSSLIKELEDKEDELEELEEELDKKEILLRELSVLTDDISKCIKYREELQVYIETNQTEEEEIAQQSQEIDEKCDQVKIKIEKLEVLVRDQPIKKSEAEDLMRRDNEFQLKLDQLNEQADKTKHEMEEAKKVEKTCVEYIEQVKTECLNDLIEESRLHQSPPLPYETSSWQENKQAYLNFISKFRLLNGKEAHRELCLFKQKMSSTFSQLEEELMESSSNMEKEKEQFDKELNDYKQIICPDLLEELKQMRRNIDNVLFELKEEDTNYELQEENFNKEEAKLLGELENKLTFSKTEKDCQLKLLETEKIDIQDKIDQMNIFIRKFVGNMRIANNSILKDSKTLYEGCMKDYEAAKDRYQTVRGAKFRKLKKKLMQAKLLEDN